ncbi:MAG: glucosaminidase domain-containing protein [Puniceicoccales bacterium]|jgi:hypothetical protein|nr:glucosaminidase domain-containing protein [Puniceicoccales bacterium]
MKLRCLAFVAISCIILGDYVKAAPINDNIMGVDRVSAEKLTEFLVRNNPNIKQDYARRIVRIYDTECRAEGVRLTVAFSQMCLETGFLRFGNDVRPEQNNFCGFGAVGSNACGNYFSTMNEGVRAHVQHLKAYASKRKTTHPCVDARRKMVQLGSAQKVSKLSGRWAADRNYGKKILEIMGRIQTECH